MNNPAIGHFVVTVYNINRWKFAPYSSLYKTFQEQYEFVAYSDLMSSIRSSLKHYVNDELQMVWSVQYKNILLMELFLFIIAVIMGIVGTLLLHSLYSQKMFGFTVIVFGLTFCGIALIICALLYLYLRGNDLIKRHKIILFEHINDGLISFNALYKENTIVQITDIISSRSCVSSAFNLDINFKIKLLKKKSINKKEKDFTQRRTTLDVADDIKEEIGKTISKNNIDEYPKDTAYKIILEITKDVKKQLKFEEKDSEKQGETVNHNHVQNVEIIYSSSDAKDDWESTLSINTASNDSCSDEKYIETEENKDFKHIASLIKSNPNELYLFHSYTTLNNIMDLISIHNNDDNDGAYNLYFIGKMIAKYFDDIFSDKNTVVIVSEKNKQPQLSYISQPHFERKIKNVKNKDIFIYRSIDYIELNPHLNEEYSINDFQKIVFNLATMYNNTKKISFELDNIYGAGCHVARAPHTNYNIFCRYSHGLIARCEWKNGEYVIAWRR